MSEVRNKLRSNRAIGWAALKTALDKLFMLCLEELGNQGVCLGYFLNPITMRDAECIAREAAQNRPDDYRIETVADVLAHLVVLRDAIENSSNGGGGNPRTDRLVHAALLLGNMESFFHLMRSDVIDNHSLQKFRREKAEQHGQQAAAHRKATAAAWQSKARAGYEARKNRNQTPESWARQHHSTYGVKWETVAKAVRSA